MARPGHIRGCRTRVSSAWWRAGSGRVADRFWDAAEGRVIPEPVHPAPHRHDSLMAQYLVADPKFDADATIMEHRKRHPKDG